MLSRQLPQPIRKFEPTPGHLSTSARGICRSCAKDVFNSSLQQSLQGTPDAASLRRSYSRLTRDLYASILRGCPWCIAVGNAVLTSSELEYWMRDWNGSRSDGASLGSTFSDEDLGWNAESQDLDVPSPRPSQMVGDNVSLGVDDSTSGGDGTSEKPGLLTVKSLDCAAMLDVKVDFLKWCGSSVFNLIRVTVEVNTADQGDCPLQEMVGDSAVIMTLEVMCDRKNTCGGATLFPGKWDAVSAAAPREWATRGRSWLQSCNEHTSCAPTKPFRPTRLIDIRNPDHPRLTDSDCGPQNGTHRYAALSYVWGLKQEYVLTKAALAEMRLELDLLKLPKTISDAIKVAHELGFDYLWVDALCIMQDSPEDKAQELPLMADIYKGSSLCIVAAGAAAADQGFLEAPTPLRFLLEPFEVSLGPSGNGLPHSLTFGYRAPYMASADPINSRAWTLQERVLSRRLLIFSRSGVMWMCQECYVNPAAAPDAGPPYQTSLGFNTAAERSISDDGDDQAGGVLESWMAIRADYTEMDLTYCADKLPAISAVAAEVGRRTGWTYLAGLWEGNLLSELHWRSTKRSPSGEMLVLKPDKAKQAGYLAPSWSWASVGLGSILDSEDERVDREVFGFSILKYHIDVDPSFPFGPVKGGYLEVKGMALELAWRLEDRPEWDGSDVSLLDPQEKSDIGGPLVVGDGTLDPQDEYLDPSVKLVCLGMSKLRLGRQRIVPVEGLLLLPMASGNGCFRRVGFFRMTAPSVYDGATDRILRIE